MRSKTHRMNYFDAINPELRIEFQGLLQDMTNKWTCKEIGFGFAPAEKGKGAVLVRTMNAMRNIVEDALVKTAGRVSYWRQADKALTELMERRWAGKWKNEKTWMLLRSWNETLGNNDDDVDRRQAQRNLK